MEKLKAYLIYFVAFSVGGLAAIGMFDVISRSIARSHKNSQGSISKSSSPLKNGSPDKQITEVLPNPQVKKSSNAFTFNSRVAEEKPDDFVLNGVFVTDNESYALINNNIVKEGDTLSGATVIKIAPEEVKLQVNNRQIKISTKSY